MTCTDCRVSANSQTNQTSPSASGQPSATKSLKSSNSPVESQPTNKSTKRKLQAEGKNLEKKKAKLQSSEMRTAIEYDGIGSCDSETASSVNKEDKILSKYLASVLLVKTMPFFSSKLENIFSNTQSSF